MPSGLCSIAELDGATCRLIQCSGQACRWRVACCGLQPFCAELGPGRVPFVTTPVPKDVELAWASAVMTILYHNSNSFLSAKPRNNVPNAARQPWARVGGDDGAGIVQSLLLLSSGTKAPGGICFGAT